MTSMISFLLWITSAFLVLNMALYTFQDHYILYPPSKSDFSDRIPNKHHITLNINGVELNGIQRMERSSQNITIIYFGGNAEDVNYNYFDFINALNANFVAINYRGFAGNPGKAKLEQISLDADAIIAQIIERFELKTERIILMGRSLGSAFAINLVQKYDIAGIIAITPFDSLSKLGKRHYPFLPVSLLLKKDFNNVVIAKTSLKPILIISGDKDNIIPAIHSKTLYEAWQGNNKKFVTIKNAGHNNIQDFPAYYHEINKFIDSLK